MKARSARWIVSSTAVALWVTVAHAASVELKMHWYIAIVLATAVASGGVLVIWADSMARARETRRTEAGKASFDEGVQMLCQAIGEHAARTESATAKHGKQLCADLFGAERVYKYRGQTLAQLDAAMEKASRNGTDTGPLPITSIGPR